MKLTVTGDRERGRKKINDTKSGQTVKNSRQSRFLERLIKIDSLPEKMNLKKGEKTHMTNARN